MNMEHFSKISFKLQADNLERTFVFATLEEAYNKAVNHSKAFSERVTITELIEEVFIPNSTVLYGELDYRDFYFVNGDALYKCDYSDPSEQWGDYKKIPLPF